MPINPTAFDEFFIDANDITGQGFPSENLDPGLVRGTIKLVHDYYLENILGTSLLSDLKTKQKAGTLNTDETNLINNYIKNVLIYYAIFEGAFYGSYKFQNKGIEKMSGSPDASAAATLNEIQAYQDATKNRAEHYADRLSQYLQANTSLFPAYYSGTSQGDLKPLKTGYTSGMWLGNSNDYSMCSRHQCYNSQCNCNN